MTDIDLKAVMHQLALYGQRMEQGFARLAENDERHTQELMELKASVNHDLEATKIDINALRDRLHKLETDHAVTKSNGKVVAAAIAATASAIIGSIVSYVGHIAQH